MRFALVIVVLFGCGSDPEHLPESVEPAPEPLTSSMADSNRSGAEEVGAYVGVLAPRNATDVVAPSTSTVAELSIKLGDQVAKGALLGRLDTRALREQLAVANAVLRAMQADVAQATVAQRAAKNVLDRERRAYAAEIVAEAQVAAADFDERKAAMAVARSVASMQEQRAKIASLTAKLTDTTLVAPLAGKVALAYVSPGERVVEGQPIVRIISSDELFVKFAIPGDQAGKVASGAELDVKIEQQGLHTRAIVRHVAPELDPIAQMILAEAELVHPLPELQSGMVCRIRPVQASK